jgi:RES domain-containing protein
MALESASRFRQRHGCCLRYHRSIMAEFAHLGSFLNFERSVREKARFFHEQSVRDFLRAFVETSASRKRRIKEGRVLFRAQRGGAWRTENIGEEDEVEVETAHPAERMVPLARFIGNGRVNPKGIACLYLASNRVTAMAEVRPWIKSRVSLAEFKVIRDCVVVDCSLDTTRSYLLEMDHLFIDGTASEPSAAEKEAGVWGDIAYAFSKPVEPDESDLDYIATQVLAEAVRGEGYDGIVYKSLLHKTGKNIALFDTQSAELMNCCLHEAQSISFSFTQLDNPYYVLKHYPELAEHIEQE